MDVVQALDWRHVGDPTLDQATGLLEEDVVYGVVGCWAISDVDDYRLAFRDRWPRGLGFLVVVDVDGTVEGRVIVNWLNPNPRWAEWGIDSWESHEGRGRVRMPRFRGVEVSDGSKLRTVEVCRKWLATPPQVGGRRRKKGHKARAGPPDPRQVTGREGFHYGQPANVGYSSGVEWGKVWQPEVLAAGEKALRFIVADG